MCASLFFTRPPFLFNELSNTVGEGLTLAPGPHLIINQIKALDSDMLQTEINFITRMQRKNRWEGWRLCLCSSVVHNELMPSVKETSSVLK